jgi:predicted transcriptional regulator
VSHHPFPIVRFEVEGMKRSIIAALTEANLRLDEDMQRAVELALEPARVRQVLQEEAWRCTQEALKDAVRSWFLHSHDGQHVLKEEVAKRLRETYGLEPKRKARKPRP